MSTAVETPLSLVPIVAPVGTDPAVTTIRKALAASGYRELERAECEFVGGRATLHGDVGSYHLKQLAQEIVRRVDQVETVCNRLRVTEV